MMLGGLGAMMLGGEHVAGKAAGPCPPATHAYLPLPSSEALLATMTKPAVSRNSVTVRGLSSRSSRQRAHDAC
jgi:hypothetical protein